MPSLERQKVLNHSSVINLFSFQLWVLYHHLSPPLKPGLASVGTMKENCPYRSQGAPDLGEHPAGTRVRGSGKTFASIFP